MVGGVEECGWARLAHALPYATCAGSSCLPASMPACLPSHNLVPRCPNPVLEVLAGPHTPQCWPGQGHTQGRKTCAPPAPQHLAPQTPAPTPLHPVPCQKNIQCDLGLGSEKNTQGVMVDKPIYSHRRLPHGLHLGHTMLVGTPAGCCCLQGCLPATHPTNPHLTHSQNWVGPGWMSCLACPQSLHPIQGRGASG